MKKYLVFFLPLLIFFSCAQEEPVPLVQGANEASSLAPNRFTLNQAIEFAMNVAAEYNAESSRSTFSVNPDECSAIASDESRNGGDTLIHDINFADDNGFVLVNAVDNNDHFIAYIPEGHFDMEVAQTVPGFSLMLNNAIAYARELASAQPQAVIVPNPTVPDL